MYHISSYVSTVSINKCNFTSELHGWIQQIYEEGGYYLMETYLNLGGNSNVQYYRIEPDRILVKFFRTARIYCYSYFKAGKVHVDNMKRLARQGYGLNSYIMNNVRYMYD